MERLSREEKNIDSFSVSRLGSTINRYFGGKAEWTDFIPFKGDVEDSLRPMSQETQLAILEAIENDLLDPEVLSAVYLLVGV